MNGYKLIVLDLDGTLLDSNKEITDKDRKAIDLLKNMGILVTIATGRHPSNSSKYVYELGITIPIIACNGALIRDVRNGTTLRMKEVDSDVALKVINYCKQKQLDFLVYTSDAIYYSDNSERIKAIQAYNDSVSQELRVPLYRMKSLDISQQSIIKILVRSNEYQVFEKLEEHVKKDGRLTIVKSESDLIDIMTKGVSKGDGLEFLAKHLDIDLRYTVAFGDNHNDMSMLEVAGLSIAMGNAEEELKEIADYITVSNDESGVSHAVYKYILKGNGEV
ncbi:MAG: Cof-type HAD-IIB family hydrolase [Tepidanaerobacteraceae bacterium]